VLTDYPLFPLPLVAFPGCRLPLQIFEPRYLDLIKTTLSSDSTFGVVTVVPRTPGMGSEDAGIESIGTAVKIVDFNEQPNGLLGIVCEGQHKFTVNQTYLADNKVFLASAEPIEAEAVMLVPEVFEEQVYMLSSLMKHPYVASLGYIDREVEDWFTDASRLGCYLAYLLPFSNVQRYGLLALADPIERLNSIQLLLDEIDDSGV
jgi:Lon protease-like protein